MPAANPSDYLTITFETLGITALDLTDAQNAIRRGHSPRFHVKEQALRDCAALWGITPEHNLINDAGVFEAYDEVIDVQAGQCRAEIEITGSPSGMFAMTTSFSRQNSGAGSAPSIWNRIGFRSLEDARTVGLAEHRTRFNGIAMSGGTEATNARKLLDMLDEAATPQLALF